MLFRSKITQETRGWNEHKGESFSQRSKEEAHDYRYFPEPDLPPLTISADFVAKLRGELPELPEQKRARFAKAFGLSGDILETITRDRAIADYFEAMASEYDQHEKEERAVLKEKNYSLAAGLFAGEFMRLVNGSADGIVGIKITPENFAELSLLLADEKISHLAAKHVLEEMAQSGDDPSDIIERLSLWQVSDASDLEDIVTHIIKDNPNEVAAYRAGRVPVLQFLVGQVMRQSRGKANPKRVQEILVEKLN